MKKFIQKGFTLVELLVVIAILAILGTVGVVGYTAFINKAHVSNDNTFINQLNVYVKAASADLTDGDFKYVEQVNKALDQVNLESKSFKPVSKNTHFGFDVVKDEFVTIDDEKNGSVEIFAFVQGANDATEMMNKGYSLYLQDGDYTGLTEFKTGLDVGGIYFNEITYKNEGSAQTVVIRTNSQQTKLIVDAKKDTIYHYDDLKEAEIKHIASKSYHEAGNVLNNVELLDGRVVMEDGGKANAIYVSATATQITSGEVVVAAENKLSPETLIVTRDYVKEAADAKGGDNYIPAQSQENVIILSDTVPEGQNQGQSAVAYLTKSNKYFVDFAEACTSMISGDTLMLLKDVSDYGKYISVNYSSGEYKFDLNSHTVSWSQTNAGKDQMCFVVEGEANYNFVNGKFAASGYKFGDIFDIWSKTTFNGLEVEFNDPAQTSYARWGAIYNGGEELTLNGCYINAIAGPGIQNGEESAKVYVNDSKVNSNDHSALYCGGASTTYVTNSTITGVRAVHACTSGALFVINSGKFSGTQNAIQLDNTTNSVDWLGVPNYAGGSFALVYGGEFNGNLVPNSSNSGTAKIYIYGGKFTTDPTSYISGNTSVKQEDGKFIVE